MAGHKRGRAAYKKAVYIPFECIANASHTDLFEGKIRHLINVEGYTDIVLYPINAITYTIQGMRYIVEEKMSDNELYKHFHFVQNKPTRHIENGMILTYGDFIAVLAISKSF
jgi:hypothetical protein